MNQCCDRCIHFTPTDKDAEGKAMGNCSAPVPAWAVSMLSFVPISERAVWAESGERCLTFSPL